MRSADRAPFHCTEKRSHFFELRYLYIPTYSVPEHSYAAPPSNPGHPPLGGFSRQSGRRCPAGAADQATIILTQHGRRAAVLVDAGEYEALVDRAELLEDVRVAEAEIAASKGVSHRRAKAAVREAIGR